MKIGPAVFVNSWIRCDVFSQNTGVVQYIFTGTCSPSFHGNIRVEVSRMLKVIHAQESEDAARKKAKDMTVPAEAKQMYSRR